jgi:hypothetical protein
VLGDARRMLHRRSFIAAFAVFLLSFVASSRASAQSISVAHEASLQRLDASGQPAPKRALFLNPEAINAQDCRDDQRIRLAVEMSGFQANAVVQIWASTGSDCSTATNRESPTAPCWEIVPAVPLQPTTNVDLPVRALLSPAADDASCGTVDLTMIDVQILMFAPGAYDAPIVAKHVSIIADTIGPEPPRAAISAGNGRARVEIRASNELVSISSMTAYCDRSAAADSCTSTTLVPGSDPPKDPIFECGNVPGSGATTFFTEPLENGASHVVAVAARDAFGNLGPLSTFTCVTPSPDAETQVGSLDEPTGCAVGAIGGSQTGRGGALAVVVALGLVVVGRRRAGQPR